MKPTNLITLCFSCHLKLHGRQKNGAYNASMQTKAGLAAAKARGVKLGNPTKLPPKATAEGRARSAATSGKRAKDFSEQLRPVLAPLDHLSANAAAAKELEQRGILLLLLDEPQPRKTNGEDHHHDQNGVLYHRSCPELMFANQDCGSASHSALDPDQERFLLFWVLFHVAATVLERTMARATIAYLEQRYTALEKEIVDALRQSPTDDLAIADLKYRKLIIADEIQQDRRWAERFDKRGAQ